MTHQNAALSGNCEVGQRCAQGQDATKILAARLTATTKSHNSTLLASNRTPECRKNPEVVDLSFARARANAFGFAG